MMQRALLFTLETMGEVLPLLILELPNQRVPGCRHFMQLAGLDVVDCLLPVVLQQVRVNELGIRRSWQLGLEIFDRALQIAGSTSLGLVKSGNGAGKVLLARGQVLNVLLEIRQVAALEFGKLDPNGLTAIDIVVLGIIVDRRRGWSV